MDTPTDDVIEMAVNAAILIGKEFLPQVEENVILTACKKIEIFKTMLTNAEKNIPSGHPLKKFFEEKGIDALMMLANLAEKELNCPIV